MSANTNYGACRFCGQTFLVEPEELENYCQPFTVEEMESDKLDEVINWVATMRCNCEGARHEQYVEGVKEQTKANIDELFSDDHSEAAEVLKAAADILAEGKIAGLAMQLGKKTRASMTRNTKGEIKVKRTVTSTDTLES